MSDRDRLVELLKEADDATEVHDCDYPTYEEAIQAFYTSIADYLLANGVIVPPCKVGDTVWIVRENIYEATVHRVVLSISESDNFINLGVGYEYADWFYDDGRKATAKELCIYLRDAFPTKEEAEAKLEELKGE